ncbi:MAG TPA: hypothetical protein VF136_09690 [Methylomirabilota bacterium]|jgi:hypothetical protein
MTLVTGLVGAIMMMAFLGFLVWWIQELPFTIIVLVVVALMLYDFVRTLRSGDNGPGR